MTREPKTIEQLHAEIAQYEARRLHAEAQVAQVRADEAQEEADRIRSQFTATAPGR